MATQRQIATAAWLVTSPILFVIALAVASLSVRALYQFAANADRLRLGGVDREGRATPDADYLARFVASAGLDRKSFDCGDSFTRASLTVNLAALEAASDAMDMALSDAA